MSEHCLWEYKTKYLKIFYRILGHRDTLVTVSSSHWQIISIIRTNWNPIITIRLTGIFAFKLSQFLDYLVISCPNWIPDNFTNCSQVWWSDDQTATLHTRLWPAVAHISLMIDASSLDKVILTSSIFKI